MERLKVRLPYVGVVAVLAVAISLIGEQTATAQPQNQGGGPPVVAVAATQSGDWSVRTIEEVFTEDIRPTCNFANRCFAQFGAVPAGKVLRVTNVHGVMPTANAAFLALRANATISATGILFAQALTAISGSFYGNLLSFNTATDIVFTAGQTPVIEVGNAAGVGLPDSAANLFGITGQLIAVP